MATIPAGVATTGAFLAAIAVRDPTMGADLAVTRDGARSRPDGGRRSAADLIRFLAGQAGMRTAVAAR